MIESREELMALYGGNKYAVEFVEGYWKLMVFWDDMIDRDKPADDDAISEAILWALFGMQDNPFYRANRLVLRGALHQAISTWLLGNDYERSKKPGLVQQAYFMRYSAIGVFATVALLTGGPTRQREAIDYFMARARNDDTLSEYMREHLGDKYGMAQ